MICSPVCSRCRWPVDSCDCAGKILSMPLSNKEKQQAFRARNEMLGLTEVRGIFLPPELHAKLKEYAAKLKQTVTKE